MDHWCGANRAPRRGSARYRPSVNGRGRISSMTLDELRQRRAEIERTAESHGARNVRTFGSVARIPRHRSRARLGDRDGPSAAAAQSGDGRGRKGARISVLTRPNRAWVGTGVGTRGTDRVLAWPLVSAPVVSRSASVLAIPGRNRHRWRVELPPTEPKVRGSNPLGRAAGISVLEGISGHRRTPRGGNTGGNTATLMVLPLQATESQVPGSGLGDRAHSSFCSMASIEARRISERSSGRSRRRRCAVRSRG